MAQLVKTLTTYSWRLKFDFQNKQANKLIREREGGERDGGNSYSLGDNKYTSHLTKRFINNDYNLVS